MSPRPAILAHYLASVGRSAFAWGADDCCTFAADWVMALRGVDPMAALRGRYDTEAGAQALLAKLGGWIPAWRSALAGVAEVDGDPEPGDVAVVAPKPSASLLSRLRRPSGGTVALPIAEAAREPELARLGAIRTRLGWAMRVRRGVLVTDDAATFAVWRP